MAIHRNPQNPLANRPMFRQRFLIKVEPDDSACPRDQLPHPTSNHSSLKDPEGTALSRRGLNAYNFPFVSPRHRHFRILPRHTRESRSILLPE